MDGDLPAEASIALDGVAHTLDASQILSSLHMAYFRTAYNLGRESVLSQEGVVSPRCNCEARRERNRQAARAARKRQRDDKGEKEG